MFFNKIFKLKRGKVFLLILISVSVFLTSFVIVEAVGKGFCPILKGGLVPCGRKTDDPITTDICECYPCELCHIFVLFKRIVDWVTVYIIIPLAILMFVVGGVFLLTAAGDPGRISGGKKILKTTIMGLIIIFVAWVIVNTIVTFASTGSVPGPGQVGQILGQSWNEIACPYCGDGICQDGNPPGEPDRGEDPVTCPLDCLAFIWVPLSGNDQLLQISLEDGSIFDTYDVGDNPSRLTVIPGGDVWIANRNSANVTRFSPDLTNLPHYKKPGDTYSVGNGPRAVTYDLNGNIWVGNCGDGTVMKLNPENGNQLIAPINVGGCPYGAIGDPYGYIWIANRGTASVNRIDINTNTLILPSTSMPAGTNIYGIGMDNEGDIWVAGYEGGGVYEIAGRGKTNTGTIIKSALLGISGFRGIAVDGKNYVWVANSSNNNVYVIDPDGNQVTGSPIATGYADVIGVAIDRQNNGWVVSNGSGRVLKYEAVGDPDGDGAHLEKLLDINVGDSPYNYSDMTGFRSMGCPKPR